MSAPTAFGDSPSGPGDYSPVSPPVPHLVVAAVALVASVGLLLAGPFADVAHVIGWLLASVVAIGAIAMFTAEDLKRRQLANYAPMPAASNARWALAVLALVLCGAHAWTLAWSLAAR